jgi:hypothetical protein
MTSFDLSMVKQLRASELDQEIPTFRDELHLIGALEAWLFEEGKQPWDSEQFSVDGQVVNFSFGKGYWQAHMVQSLNFPHVLKMELGVDVASVKMHQAQGLFEFLPKLNNPHFCLKVSPWEADEYLVSAVTHLAVEPKNAQLAIGVAMNDIISVLDSLLNILMEIPGTESLLNY